MMIAMAEHVRLWTVTSRERAASSAASFRLRRRARR